MLKSLGDHLEKKKRKPQIYSTYCFWKGFTPGEEATITKQTDILDEFNILLFLAASEFIAGIDVYHDVFPRLMSFRGSILIMEKCR